MIRGLQTEGKNKNGRMVSRTHFGIKTEVLTLTRGENNKMM